MTVVSKAALGERSPGQLFAEACRSAGTGASVELEYPVLDALLGSRRKPRHPVRSLLTVIDLSVTPTARWWHEEAAPDSDGPFGLVRPEDARRFVSREVPALVTTDAWVQVPVSILEDPVALASFVDLRLLVRLATAENATLLTGHDGLLVRDDIVRFDRAGDLASAIIDACLHVEVMGGTADGVVVHPTDYWRYVSQGRLVRDLEAEGITVSRTRLVPMGQAVIGDFGHGARLLDAGRSLIRFDEPPPGRFADAGLALNARIHERLVIGLPMNVCHVTTS